MILDSSYLIDLFVGIEDAFNKGLELSESNTIQRLPTPVIMELSYGASFAGQNELRNVQNALRMYPIVNQNDKIANLAGQLLSEADSKAEGQSGIDKIDPMIAAVAEIYEEPVLTSNVSDFRLLGAEIETYLK